MTRVPATSDDVTPELPRADIERAHLHVDPEEFGYVALQSAAGLLEADPGEQETRDA